MPSTEYFGPFVHKLNKGGLDEIVRTGLMRGTLAGNNMPNDDPTVRAYRGAFEAHQKQKRWDADSKLVIIEFLSLVEPRSGTQPWAAEWRGDQLVDGHLPIRILRVLTGTGKLLHG